MKYQVETSGVQFVHMSNDMEHYTVVELAVKRKGMLIASIQPEDNVNIRTFFAMVADVIEKDLASQGYIGAGVSNAVKSLEGQVDDVCTLMTIKMELGFRRAGAVILRSVEV